MPTPISAPAPVAAAPMTGDLTAALTGNAAGADFAALFLAQIDLGSVALDEDEPVAAPSDTVTPGVTGIDTNLAALLNAVVLPTNAQPTPAPAAATSSLQKNDAVVAIAAKSSAIGVELPAGEGKKSAAAALTGASVAVENGAAPGAQTALTAPQEAPTANPTLAPARIADPVAKAVAAETKPADAVQQAPGGTAAIPGGPAINGADAGNHATHRTLPSPQVRVDTPLGNSAWATDVGQRVVWMARQDVQSAQLSINPPQLGPIEVNLSIGREQVTAVFSSPHAEVREALESAMPRLREMFASSGISLGQTHVNSQDRQPAGNPEQAASRASLPRDDGSILSGGSEIRSLTQTYFRGGNGLVDTFA